MIMRPLPFFLPTVTLIFACGQSANDTAKASAPEAGTAYEVGAAPADGAPGKCCPPSTGGCAYVGGYRSSGVCDAEYCDNLCNQRIVADEHGCRKMVFDPCPSQSVPSCNYPSVQNDPRCPASYSYSFGQKTCPEVGLRCEYPGQGDGTTDGCYATAMLSCVADTASDAGPDATADASDGGQSGTWVFAQ